MKDTHGSQDDVPTPCKVQTVGTSCIKTYFGVQPEMVGAQTTMAVGASEIGTIVAKSMSLVLKTSDTVPPNAIQERNLLYVITGWYPEPEKSDTFSHVTNKAALVKLPDPNDQLHSLVRPLINMFCAFVTKVKKSCSYQLRPAVSDSADRHGGSMPRIITSLQTEKCVREYCSVYTRLVLFAIRLATQKVVATSEDIVS